MLRQTKPQIPLEKRIDIDDLMAKVWKDDVAALEKITQILSDYNKRGFDTMDYAAELLRYSATKNQLVLFENVCN